MNVYRFFSDFKNVLPYLSIENFFSFWYLQKITQHIFLICVLPYLVFTEVVFCQMPYVAYLPELAALLCSEKYKERRADLMAQ